MALAGGHSLQEQLGDEQLRDMASAGMTDEGLRHVATREYTLKCNWKVFADNYLVCGTSLHLHSCLAGCCRARSPYTLLI